MIRASARIRDSLLPVRLSIDAYRKEAVLYPERLFFIPAGLVYSVSIAIFTGFSGILPANDPNLKIRKS